MDASRIAQSIAFAAEFNPPVVVCNKSHACARIQSVAEVLFAEFLGKGRRREFDGSIRFHSLQQQAVSHCAAVAYAA